MAGVTQEILMQQSAAKRKTKKRAELPQRAGCSACEGFSLGVGCAVSLSQLCSGH